MASATRRELSSTPVTAITLTWPPPNSWRLGFGDDVIQGTLDYQLVKQTFEWKQPACFDQVLEVAVAATRLGNTSFTLHSEFRIAGDERPIAGVETVYVLVDSVTLQKRELPPDFRAALDAECPTRLPTTRTTWASP